MNKINKILAVVVALISIGSGIGAWVIMPWKQAALEKRMSDVEEEQREYRRDVAAIKEMLGRMDERQKAASVALAKIEEAASRGPFHPPPRPFN